MIMKYWFPTVPAVEWSAIFLVLLFCINILSVKGFGEAEFWMSLLKVIVVILFLIFGVLIAAGVIGHHKTGLHNWHTPGAPFHGGILAIIGVFMVAGFSFQGTELVGIAAGETENPSKSIPRAIRKIFWRILLFYILSLAVIGTLIPHNSTELLQNDIFTSPFTLVFKLAGIPEAASLMNFVILIAVLSAANSGMYASSRMLWYLAKNNHAPRIFKKIDRRGVPLFALIATTLVGALAFLSSRFGDGSIYIWLLNASGLSGFIAWLGIAISHYRFRRAYVLQKRDLNALPYRAKAFPFGPLFATALCLIIIFGQNTDILSGHVNVYSLLVSYIGLPLFLILWLGYKVIHRTKVIPLKDCNFELKSDD